MNELPNICIVQLKNRHTGIINTYCALKLKIFKQDYKKELNRLKNDFENFILCGDMNWLQEDFKSDFEITRSHENGDSAIDIIEMNYELKKKIALPSSSDHWIL